MTDISSAQIGTAARSAEPEFRDFVLLLKPRVMSLVVFTALAGMVAAPVWIHPVVALASLLCIAVGHTDRRRPPRIRCSAGFR